MQEVYNSAIASANSLVSWKPSTVIFMWAIEIVPADDESFAVMRLTPIDSPLFCDDSGLKWRLRVHLSGTRYASRHYLSVFLRYSRENKHSTARPKVQYKFTLVDAAGKCIYQRDSGFHLWKDPTPGGQDGVEKFIRRDHLFDLLRNNAKISIACQLIIYDSKIDGVDKFISQPLSKVSGDFETMFDRQESGDTIIRASDGKEFRVYREILQARSPVFAAMFQHDMMEKNQHRIVIEDVESDVMKEMLIYIYTGRSPNLQGMAYKLLPVADKYDLGELKIMSEKVLATNLTRENANDTLSLAHSHGSNEFKEFVARFMGIECSDFPRAAVRVGNSRRKNYWRTLLLEMLFWLKLFIFIPFIALLLPILYLCNLILKFLYFCTNAIMMRPYAKRWSHWKDFS